MRYHLSDLLEDFKGSEQWAELLLIAAELAEAATELWLAHHRHWSGRGKWLHWALNKLNPKL